MFGDRILMLIPHPDDELVGAATAIERLRRAGGKAFGLYLTTGVPPSAGSWFGGEKSYQKAVDRRWQEAKRVAETIGLEIADRQEIPARGLKSEIASSIARVREFSIASHIDKIWVPAYEGGHQDHDVANYIGSRIAEEIPVWEFSEYHFARGRVQSQVFIQSVGSENRLDLDDSEKTRKRDLLLTYASEQRNLDYVRLDQEVFRPLIDYDYSHPPHPGRTFYQRFQWIPYHPRIDYCRPEQVCQAIQSAN